MRSAMHAENGYREDESDPDPYLVDPYDREYLYGQEEVEDDSERFECQQLALDEDYE